MARHAGVPPETITIGPLGGLTRMAFSGQPACRVGDSGGRPVGQPVAGIAAVCGRFWCSIPTSMSDPCSILCSRLARWI